MLNVDAALDALLKSDLNFDIHSRGYETGGCIFQIHTCR